MLTEPPEQANAKLRERIAELEQQLASCQTLLSGDTATRLSMALSAAALGDWSWDATSDVITFSPRAAEILGAPDLQLPRKVARTLIHPEDLERVRAELERVLARGCDYRLQYRLAGSEDNPRWVLATGRPVYEADGPVTGMIGVVQDISAEQRLLQREQQARRRAELLNQVGPLLLAELDSNRLVQAVTDIATQLIDAQTGALNALNEAGESYPLYTVSGVPRSAFEGFPQPGNAGIFGPAFRGEGTIRSDDITQDTPYGKNAPCYQMPESHLPVKSYLAVPVRSRSGAVIGRLIFGHAKPGMFTREHEQLIEGIAAQAAIAMDNARLFEQLRRERAQTEEANRALREANADLEQFAFSASHDLQEPLRMVAIYSQIIKQQFTGQLGPKGDEYLAYAIEGATRMESLVRGLLAYTRASTPLDEPQALTDANAALETTKANLQAAITTSGATITSDPLPQLRIPELHLDQLLQNLIGNAIKYRSTSPPAIHIGAERRDTSWVLSVRDNGIGISSRYKDQIFGVFKRLHTNADYPGTGIGLAICKRIVERAGGRIWVESEQGTGSTFFVELAAQSVEIRAAC